MSSTKTTYYIDGLCCSEEESVIRKKLGTVKGIDELTFNLISRKVTVAHSCSGEAIVEAIRSVGFAPRLHFDIGDDAGFFERNQANISAGAGGVLFLAGIIADLSGITSPAVVPMLFILSAVAAGWKIAYKGWKAATNGSLEMNFLMVLATIGAMAIGKWTEGAAIVLLFSFSQLLESFSMARTRNAIRSMANMSPAMATVIREGFEFAVKVEEINVGDIVRLQPGERVPLDGVVTSGSSFVNQAPITGESLPVAKSIGSEMFAGSLNEHGSLEMRVSRRYYDSTLNRIIAGVEQAQSERAPMQQLVERFSAIYTPAVVILAFGILVLPPLLFGGLWGVWFYRALTLIVIACPCALVISTPVTIVSALTNAARRGILIKGGRHLEAMGAISAIAFDKTGTLTEGAPRVTDVISLNGTSNEDILRLTATIEARSEHPLAGAILRHAFDSAINVDTLQFVHCESLAGRGVRAVIEGHAYFVGNHALVEEAHLCSPQVEEILNRLEAEGKTTTILCNEHGTLGIIAVRDTIRTEGRQLVDALHREGVTTVALLTGDNRNSAAELAGRVGIDLVHADLMPGDKVRIVKELIASELQNHRGLVAMIGDGINDAPALAAASVGIAMGKTGTDAALETADIVLMTEDLRNIPFIVRLGRRATGIIRQNLFLAVGLKIVFLALGMMGYTSLWLAVLADDGATLIVILNGLRMLRAEA